MAESGLTAVLRACAGCGGQYLGHDSRSMSGAYICPKCGDLVVTGDELMPGDTVHRIDGPTEDLIVVDRSGFTLEARRPGSDKTFLINAWTVYRIEYYGRRKARVS